ncbi:MAG TPA: SRPBCC family protein [Candidatus Binataceae bacterium]|nr:SRPBCC family protein [Candidatus Binataceae bacterium]
MKKAASPKNPAPKSSAKKSSAGQSTTTIRQSAIIPATPVEVYDAFVNARKHAAFTGAAAKSANKVGGKFTAWDDYISGKYLELVAGRKIVEEWRTGDWPAGCEPSLIEFTFARVDKNTRVTMVQTKVPAAQAANYRQGWKDYYWTPLKAYFQAQRQRAVKSL